MAAARRIAPPAPGSAREPTPPISAGSRSRFPASREYPHFDRRAFKARVTFATLAPDELSANFKFAPDEQALKCAVQRRTPSPPLDNAWGRQGWTRATLAALSEPELSAALEMAWRRGAAKAKRKRR